MAVLDETKAGAVLERATAASFVQLCSAPSPPAIVATGALSSFLENRHIPYQSRIVREVVPTNADDLSIAIGSMNQVGDEVLQLDDPIGDVDELFAGCDENVPGLLRVGKVFDQRSVGVSTDDGLGIPVSDSVDGLVHSTLVHARFSGAPEVARELISRLAVAPRETRSLLAVNTLGTLPVTAAAADAVALLLNGATSPDVPYGTIVGTADVLDTLAETAPGMALAIVCGHSQSIENGLEQWRSGSEQLHQHLRSTTDTSDSSFVMEVADAPVAATARVVSDCFDRPQPFMVHNGEDAAISIDGGFAAELNTVLDDVVWHDARRARGKLIDDPTAVSEQIEGYHA